MAEGNGLLNRRTGIYLYRGFESRPLRFFQSRYQVKSLATPEAQSCGKAVIAFGKGGVLETVWGLDTFAHEQLGPTGVSFYEQSVAALRQAILEFEERRGEINPQACRENALRFDRSVYKRARSIQNCIQAITAATAPLKSASVSKSHPHTIS